MRRIALRARANWRAVLVAALAVAAACGSDSTSAPKAVSIALVSSGALSGVVGQPLPTSPQIQILDASGNAISGVSFTVAVIGGGTLTGTPSRTVSGATSLGTWTLGPTAGTQSLQVTSSTLTLTIVATALPGPASVATGVGSLTATGAVSTVAPIQPSIKVADSFGNGIANVQVTVAVTGGGSVQNPNPVTDANGVASAGTWTLGSLFGTQTVTMTAQGLPPVVFSVVTNPGSILIVAGDGQTGTPNAPLPTNIVIRVVTGAGLPVPNQSVQFAVQSGGGNVSIVNTTTDASGQASPGVWTLGSTFGSQTLHVTAGTLSLTIFATAMAPPGGTFTVDVRFEGGTPTAAVQAAFSAAAARMQQVIVASLTPIPVNSRNVGNDCGESSLNTLVLNETVPNIIIFAEIVPIDGPGQILGSTGPCLVRVTGSLPVTALMKFDSADIANMVAAGTINSVVLHEMQHALGYGTIWTGGSLPTLLQNQSSPGNVLNTIFLGAAARGAYLSLGGTSALGVPVENTGGAGTVNSHWRESVFQTELMTGFLTGLTQPYSKISMGSLADLGYSVSYATADAYQVPAPGQIRNGFEITALVPVAEQFIYPSGAIDEHGRVTPIVHDSLGVGGKVTPQSVRKQ